jgi:hypothetical protein
MSASIIRKGGPNFKATRGESTPAKSLLRRLWSEARDPSALKRSTSRVRSRGRSGGERRPQKTKHATRRGDDVDVSRRTETAAGALETRGECPCRPPAGIRNEKGSRESSGPDCTHASARHGGRLLLQSISIPGSGGWLPHPALSPSERFIHVDRLGRRCTSSRVYNRFFPPSVPGTRLRGGRANLLCMAKTALFLYVLGLDIYESIFYILNTPVFPFRTCS